MKRNAIRWVAGAAALAAILGLGTATTASQARGRVAQLEAHGRVIWVTERVETGEVLAIRAGSIHVSAKDTDPASPAWCGVTCASGDRVLSTLDDGDRQTQGAFAPGSRPGTSSLFLPGGLDMLFVDGGKPGARVVGPPNSAGIAPTADYVQLLQTSPAYTHKAYFQSGGIQLIGS